HAQVRDRMSAVQVGAPALWPWVELRIEEAIAAGLLRAA
ncbi:MAG: phosphohydrolase, partial [Leptolyngbya sp. DLM2.Bin15]